MATRRKRRDSARDRLASLQHAYRQTFGSPMGQCVWADLTASFSTRSSFTRDPLTTAFREGERSVWLRIQAFLTKDLDALLPPQSQEVHDVERDSDPYLGVPTDAPDSDA